MRRLGLLAVLPLGGCAVSIGAIAHHNSGGSCIDTTAFGVVDIIAAAGTAVLVVHQEAHPGYFAVPAVLGLSGLFGVLPCSKDSASGGTAEQAPRQRVFEDSYQLPKPTDEKLGRDPTLEEQGLVVPPEPTRIPCSTNPPTGCPEHHSCVLVNVYDGFCRPD